MRWPRVSELLLLIVVMQIMLIFRSMPPPCPPPRPLTPPTWSAVKRVGVLVVATGRYVSFVSQLLTDLSLYFLPGYNVSAVIFTDEPHPPGCTVQRCRVVPHVRYGWPYDTLLRWEGAHHFSLCYPFFFLNQNIAAYANASAVLSDFDFLFAIDADMRIEATVGSEIFGPLVGVLHPAYHSAAVKDFTYEQSNAHSAAYIAPGEGHHYFAGGVSGGERAKFLEMARAISAGARRDLANGAFVAVRVLPRCIDR